MVDESGPDDSTSVIKQGSIASFMRKRTQLVGFDTGHFKHVQYAVEFLDNALDAMETFHWKNVDQDKGYTLESEFFQDWVDMEDELMEAHTKEVEGLSSDLSSAFMTLGEGNGDVASGEVQVHVEPEIKTAPVPVKAKAKHDTRTDADKRVQEILQVMGSLITPYLNLVVNEPIALIRISEIEDKSLVFLDESKGSKLYCFEVFDSGTGINPGDLEKFGTYLASSKSEKLKQTRGSQGFGSPSAFSDAQNTTGKPIQVISKHYKNDKAYLSEFFTTGENKKSYTIEPAVVDVAFPHGTYIKLNYTNIRYVRGYVDQYVKQTALMNSHVNIVFIDPYNETHMFKRLVNEFPDEPKYAKPHPSSINIGEFQDMLRTTSYDSIRHFLSNSFVRISDKMGQGIIESAEEELQDRLGFLRLSPTDYITLGAKADDFVYVLREEKRVFGKSTKPRKQWVVYMLNVAREDVVSAHATVFKKYKSALSAITKIDGEIKKLDAARDATSKKKDKTEFTKQIKELEKQRTAEDKNKDAIKKDMLAFVEANLNGFEEIADEKGAGVVHEKLASISIADTPPRDLKEIQINTLYKFFTLEKYLSPPTDTAIPVGADVMESVLIQEFGLKISKYDLYFADDETDASVENDIVALPRLQKELKENLVEESEEETSLHRLVQLDEAAFVKRMAILPLKKAIDEAGDVKAALAQDVLAIEPDAYKSRDLQIEELVEEDLDFVSAVTRPPTSGKGLAFVVEAAVSYGNNVKATAKASDVVFRFVNRTPKLRDNADCAIWRTVSMVNWKNYMVDTFDNGIPKGNIRVFVNVSGPFVHLMFKSQSKQALAEDENLAKEIKLALEQLGRRLRAYLSKKQKHAESKKRASKFIQFAPHVARSLYNILAASSPPGTSLVPPESLEERIIEAIGKKVSDVVPAAAPVIRAPVAKPGARPRPAPEPEQDAGPAAPVEDGPAPRPRERKTVQQTLPGSMDAGGVREVVPETKVVVTQKVAKPGAAKPVAGKPAPSKPAIAKTAPAKPVSAAPEIALVDKEDISAQEKAPVKVTEENILKYMPDGKYVKISYLIKALNIKDINDARFLEMKLKALARDGRIEKIAHEGKSHYKKK